jgi:hypothetical protein
MVSFKIVNSILTLRKLLIKLTLLLTFCIINYNYLSTAVDTPPHFAILHISIRANNFLSFYFNIKNFQ